MRFCTPGGTVWTALRFAEGSARPDGRIIFAQAWGPDMLWVPSDLKEAASGAASDAHAGLYTMLFDCSLMILSHCYTHYITLYIVTLDRVGSPRGRARGARVRGGLGVRRSPRLPLLLRRVPFGCTHASVVCFRCTAVHVRGAPPGLPYISRARQSNQYPCVQYMVAHDA